MLTWWSASDAATSRSSRARSSASTSIETTKVPSCVVVPLDLDEPVALAGGERHGVGAVGAVHRHAAAPGDEADDLVARHRGAAPRQPHHHVVEALDVHARRRGARPRGPRGGRAVVGQLLLAARVAAAQLLREPLRDRLGRHVALADRGVQRLEVGVVAATRRPSSSSVGRASFWTGRPSRRSALTSSSRPVSMASSRRSRENHWRIFVAARGVATNCSQSRRRARALDLDVKISTVSPDDSCESSGTSRPLTRAPMQRWPTSVWMA